MEENVENKPKFILNKQKGDTPLPVQPKEESVQPKDDVVLASSSAPSQSKEESAQPEKKKVVVVKKKPTAPMQNGAPAPERRNADGSDKNRPVVKRAPPAGQGTDAPQPKRDAPPSRPAPSETGASSLRKTGGTFELSPTRPNVKAGNLSERPRGGGYNNGGGYGSNNNRNDRPPFPRGGAPAPRQGNVPPQFRGADNFTGAQAREGYQNRFNDQRPGGQGAGQGGYHPRDGGTGRPGGGGQGYRQGPPTGGRPGFGGGGGRPGFGAPPQQPLGDAKKVPAKKTFKGKKTVYSKRDREEEYADKLLNTKKKQSAKSSAVPTEIEIMEMISVSDLARKMNLKASALIAKLMSLGMMVTINQSIDADTATLLAAEYNCEVHIVSLYDETVIESDTTSGGEQKTRPPVVTIMGHVDHGKTKTLDAIRSTHVAESEFGGITQHIGAYVVQTAKGKITFLDTPGHEAFTMMRSRGAKITDIVVLVVAADDGVMPQTIEAIDHAKAANVPIIVAVNKVDKPDANPDRVKTQLSDLGFAPEEWGGETQYVHISALRKEGLDDLLDAILLRAEVQELKSVWDCRAEGKILDSKVDHGRGVVSTVLIEQGTLKTGDAFVAGVYSGRIRAIFNDLGEKIAEATPSMPVEILGMDATPNAGDPFQVTDTEKTARAISAKRQELKRSEDAKSVKKITLDNLYANIDAQSITELKVVIKADVQGSAEALKSSLEKLSTRDIRLTVIHSSAGAINESDVMLAASDTNAIIIGFNVRPSPKAKALADQEGVDIRKYNVIYKAVEEITLAMEGMLAPDEKEEVIGMLEVRETFKVPKAGVIAGSYVTQGLIKRSASVNIIRSGIVVYTGKVSSLKRFKDDAKEVATGYECGVGIDSWQDIQVGDQFEVFEYIKVARKLGDSAPLNAAATATKDSAPDSAKESTKDSATDSAPKMDTLNETDEKESDVAAKSGEE